MKSRTKKMSISKVEGAKENGVEWLISCGVQTREEAKEVAAAFMEDLEKVQAGRKAGAQTTKK